MTLTRKTVLLWLAVVVAFLVTVATDTFLTKVVA